MNIIIAQDILGGEIRYTHVSGFTYHFEKTLYTLTSSGITHQGVPVNHPNDITEWIYIGQYTYPGTGNYSIISEDSFRVAGIQNIINSASERITLKADLLINAFVGSNSSPVFYTNQLDVATDGISVFHNAVAYDPDGDSLVYSLVASSSSNYNFPVGATIDPNTGLFSMPLSNSSFAINIEVKEFRNGIHIGAVYREMVIDSTLITNINEINNHESKINVYPNPTTGIVNIISETPIDKIVVYDVMGKEVVIFINPGKNIDLRDYKNGIYILMINDQKGNIYRTLLYKI